MDNILGNLLGGQQQQLQDFTQRYQQGAPWDGISDQEALANHDQVAQQIPPEMYEQSARESFDRLQPQQREELGQVLVQRAPQFGVQVPQAQPSQLQDSGFLAQLTGQLQRQQPGALGQILGGAMGGGSGSTGGAGGIGGAVASMLGGSQQGAQSQQAQAGGMLSNPIAKAALAGIAAMAVQRVTGGR
jgi:hypothetical protein